MPSLAIIPARGGSKRIPNKNKLLFLGKPILAYSIEAAIQSGLFEEVMVSTDDPDIAHIAEEYGAKVPFMRSQKAANDHAILADVCIEVLLKYAESGRTFDTACLILPTAPFITPEKLKRAQEILLQSSADCVIPITEYSFPIQRSVREKEGMIEMNWPQYRDTRSQDLEKTYHDAGQLYYFKTQAMMNQKSLPMKDTAGMIHDNLEVQDIDSMTDWKIAELKYQLWKKETAGL